MTSPDQPSREPLLKQLDPAAPPCACDHLTGIECGHHLGLTQRVRHEGFEPVARTLGWIPLTEVLAALRELDPAEAALAVQAAFHVAADMLAARFAPTGPQGADERNGHG